MRSASGASSASSKACSISRLGRARPVWRQAQHRQVGCAAADVEDQHDLFPRQTLFIIQRGGDGFELKLNIAKAAGTGNLFQHGLRCGIACRIVIDEMHRPAKHRLCQTGMRGIQTRAQMGDETLHDIAKGDGAVAHNGAVIDQPRSQRGFQPTHQAAFIALQIGGQRGAAEIGGQTIGVKEYGRRQRDLIPFQRDQPRVIRIGQPDGGV